MLVVKPDALVPLVDPPTVRTEVKCVELIRERELVPLRLRRRCEFSGAWLLTQRVARKAETGNSRQAKGIKYFGVTMLGNFSHKLNSCFHTLGDRGQKPSPAASIFLGEDRHGKSRFVGKPTEGESAAIFMK
jgi:hypothetical protein